jgi:hypothetical protein
MGHARDIRNACSVLTIRDPSALYPEWPTEGNLRVPIAKIVVWSDASLHLADR